VGDVHVGIAVDGNFFVFDKLVQAANSYLLQGAALRDFTWTRRGIDSAIRIEKSFNRSMCCHVLEFLLRS